MAIEKVDIQKFLELGKVYPVLDARSPGEFAHAHFPGAISFPLFDDEERKVVGTAYKQKGREEAIKIGLDYFGLKMRKMVEEVEKIVAQLPVSDQSQNTISNGPLPPAANTIWGHDEKHPSKAITDFQTAKFHGSSNVLVHCWRGGMRSAAIAWLLNMYGFKVYLLEGGYKKFRHYVLETFKTAFTFKILGGFTGSGKTSILNELAGKGIAVIDLEGLANHKGSAFGTIGSQPSQEMFENMLALKLRENSATQPSPGTPGGFWLEDESQRIGAIFIPQDFWEQMYRAPVYFINIPFEKRLDKIINEYGPSGKQELMNAIHRIQKRLGGLETRNAINFLMENNTRESFRILLAYYDKCYLKSVQKRPDVVTLNEDIFETGDIKAISLKIIKALCSKQLSS